MKLKTVAALVTSLRCYEEGIAEIYGANSIPEKRVLAKHYASSDTEVQERLNHASEGYLDSLLRLIADALRKNSDWVVDELTGELK